MPQAKILKGLLSISPLLLLVLLFVGLGIYWGDFYKVPLLVIFVVVAAYSILITRHPHPSSAIAEISDAQRLSISQRIEIFSRGAGDQNLMMMLWIFLLAGAFAETAKAMGAIDATVNLTLLLLPPSMLLPGLFLAACFVSISIGTSVGTIVALVPVAVGLATPSGIATPLLVASVVGGSFFGDNLSFISDTTIVATRSQGVKQSAKFRTNIFIALPAAILCFVLYLLLGHTVHSLPSVTMVEWWKVLPYILVIVLSIIGIDVMVVLLVGLSFTAIVGILDASLPFEEVLAAAAKGMTGMSETIIIALLAGGLMAVIRNNGGIDFIIDSLTRHVRGKRGAEAAISTLVSITNCCTANNTVAILSVGNIAKDISERYDVHREKTASLLDTFSCVIQGLLPYGAQLLIAAGLSSLSPLAIIPHLYYNFLLAIFAIGSILLRYPKKYS